MRHFYAILFIISSLIAFQSCGNEDPLPPEEVVEPTPEQPTPEEPETPDDPEPPAKTFENKYYAGELFINTENAATISSKEDYVKSTISLTHPHAEWNLSEVTAGVRGRGNSTWLWYPKKPYRIKFDKKQPMLGLADAKSWVLLAEYRDPTSLMNAFVFELGQLMGLPFTNHNRYVSLTLNGKPQGLYHLTEQVQQNKARVNIDEKNGYLIQLDADDGPDLSPDAGDNFWSEKYHMPVCIKNPDEPNAEIIAEVRSSLGELEKAIAASDYAGIESLLDVKSMIDFIMIQEIVYNVELDAPRSMYMHKDVGSKWVMGPLWDFDAGFDFDWNNMERSHNYFASFKELVLGTRPATHEGTAYRVPGFFSDLFKMPDFVNAYKKRWKEVRPMIARAMEEATKFYEANTSLWEEDTAMWPIGKQPSMQISSMRDWLSNRVVFLENVIAGY